MNMKSIPSPFVAAPALLSPSPTFSSEFSFGFLSLCLLFWGLPRELVVVSGSVCSGVRKVLLWCGGLLGELTVGDAVLFEVSEVGLPLTALESSFESASLSAAVRPTARLRRRIAAGATHQCSPICPSVGSRPGALDLEHTQTPGPTLHHSPHS